MEQGAELLDGILGPFAHYAFAIGMLCAGQSSSLTGVLSTQVPLAPPPFPSSHAPLQGGH